MILLIRHAEKPDPADGSVGVRGDGSADAGSLSVRGWQRAGALAAVLGDPRRVVTMLPEPPGLLIAAQDAGRSRRPCQTLAPLAARLKIDVETYRSEGDEQAIIRRLHNGVRGGVVICWRHRELPALARALFRGDAQLVPRKWDDARFDLAWRLDGDHFDVIAQRLLDGDTACC